MSRPNLLNHRIRKFASLCIKSLLLSTLIVSIIFSIPLPKTWAASVTWNGGTDTNWNTAANWSTGVVPTSQDDVLINSNVTVNLASSVTVRSLTLGNSSGTTTPTLNFNYDAINNGALTIDGGDFTVYTNAVVTHTAGNLGAIVGRVKVVTTVGNINIAGSVNVNNKGYGVGTTRGDNGYGPGAGYGFYVAYETAGGSGGGYGSTGVPSSRVAGGARNGGLDVPTNLGSGGGYGYDYVYRTQSTPGVGGGSAYISAGGNITVSGTITANGRAGNAYSGGGSGGSIYLNGHDVTISGTLSSSGGAGGSNAGAGSGGRILVDYTGTYSCSGTISTSATSAYGTAYLRNTATGDITIPIDNPTWYTSDLSSWSFGNMYINGDITFKPDTLSMFQINSSGDMILDSNVIVKIQGYYTTDSDGVGVYFNLAGDLVVPSTSSITGNTYGYRAGTTTSLLSGMGQGKGLGLAHNYGDQPGGGGGYGGAGGNGASNTAGGTYGSLSAPVNLGSGGGFGNSYINTDGVGGAGGAAIKISADEIQIDGTLTMNGGNATYIGGGGSGGSIYLLGNTLTGAGTISATGGTGTATAYGTGGAGGGGRLSLSFGTYSWTGSSLTTSVATAKGATGNGGSNGTVYISPSFSSIGSSAITASGATLTGTVSNIEGGATDRGFEYSLNSEFTSSTQVSKGASSTSGAITTDLSGLSETTTYYYRLYATVQGTTTYSQSYTFTTLQSNTAPAAQASDISGATNLYAGKTIDIVAKYSDADGYVDLDKLYLYLKNPEGTDIQYYATSTGSTLTGQTPTEVSGGTYIASLTYDITVNTPSSNDITVVWHITPGWNWILSTNIQYGVKAVDAKTVASTEDYYSNKYLYENRLTIYGTFTATDKNGVAITSGNWTYPNSNITFSGVRVTYYGTTSIYPNDSDFDITISNSLSQTATDTTSSGENISVTSTTPNTTNTNIVYTLSISNLSTGGVDLSGNPTITIKTDKTSPSITGLSSSIYATQDKWYSSASNTFSWTPTETDSGIQDYTYIVDTNATITSNTLLTTGTKIVISSITLNSIANGISYFHILARDNVDNVSEVATYTLKRDATTPDIVNISGLYNGIWQNINSGPIISWTDPSSPSDDTFYITNDGTDPSSTNFTYTTTSTTYDLPSQSDGETVIKVRALNGAGTYSKIKTFVIRYDKTAPANINSLLATTTDTSIVLTWQNPTSDFSKTIIMRNDLHTPTNLTDGTRVYEGTNITYTDTNLKNSQKYYYTAFVLDNVGNISSGAIVSASLATKVESLVPAITENTKVVQVSQLTQSQAVTILTENKPVLTTTNSDTVNVYSSQAVNIVVPAETINSNTTDVQKVLLIVNSEVFQMLYDSVKNAYKATISAPSIKGTYDTTILTVSADNTSEFAIKLSIKVDPRGYVYYKVGKNELRITDAKVSLYQKVDGTDVLWISEDGTANPQYTNQTGEFSFFVNPGEYKLVVEADGYKTTETEWFTVETNIIEKNIQMVKNLTIPIIAASAGLAILITTSVVIIRKRKK